MNSKQKDKIMSNRKRKGKEEGKNKLKEKKER